MANKEKVYLEYSDYNKLSYDEKIVYYDNIIEECKKIVKDSDFSDEQKKKILDNFKDR